MSKRESLSQGLCYTGLLGLVEAMPGTPHIVILNYHRIGNPESSPFDRGVFSATEKGMREQLVCLKQRYHALTVAQILDLKETVRKLDKPAFMVTFDDGYIDNYELAYPILQQFEIPGLFFIPTMILDGGAPFWWDAVAWLVRNSKKNLICYDPEMGKQANLNQQSREDVIREILRNIKTKTTFDYQGYLKHLASECFMNLETLMRGANAPLFMSERMIVEMHRNGMVFGSHGHTHRILSHLSIDEQEEELVQSKQKLASVLRESPVLLSYPVGSKKAFTQDTMRLASRLFTYGFSYHGGLVRKDHEEWFDVPRESVDSEDSVSLIRTRLQSLRLLNRRF
jgi:peptidoglycan/xylan/chitin deacetylase (PgdA/CDA1 family)